MSQVQSHPSSKFQFLTEQGQLLNSPEEWSECLIALDVSRESLSCLKVTLQGRELLAYAVPVSGDLRVRARWPRQGPGHYSLRLEVGSLVEERLVTILPSKIARQEYVDLLEELEFKLPCVIALRLQKCGAMSGIRIEPARSSTLEQEKQRLRRVLFGSGQRRGLFQILTELAGDLHVRLGEHTQLVPLTNANRIDVSKFHQAFYCANSLGQDGMPLRVPAKRCFESADVYENRFVAWFVSLVTRRLARLKGALQLLDQEEAVRLKAAKEALRDAAAFLGDVRADMGEPRHLSMVLLNKPLYREALELYLDFVRHAVVAIDDPALETPLNSFPYLYQLWGTLKVLEAVTLFCADRGFHCENQQVLRRVAGTSLLRLPGRGQVIAHFGDADGNRILVHLEPLYNRNHGAVRSMSNEQIPDVVIEVRKRDHPLRLLVFDPKYKLHNGGEPVKADIDKMHVYSDALRTENGDRAVGYAAILYPGDHVQYTQNLAALPASPSKENVLKVLLMEALERAVLT